MSRTAKKDAKRGRVATPQLKVPDVMLPGETEWIPGVPAYQGGTAPPTDFSNLQPYHEGDPPGWYLGPFGTVVQYGQEYTGAPMQVMNVLRPPAATQGSTGLSQFERDMQLRQQALDEKEVALRDSQATLDRQAQVAIANQDRISAQRIEAERRRLEALQLQYQGERDTLDRQLQEYQLAVTGRGQDITQRGQTIDAQLAANSQQIDSYRAELQAAQIRGDALAARDAETRLRAAQDTQTRLQRYGMQLDASGQRLQAQTMGGQQLGTLAGLEAQRQRDLITASQDPRDWMGFLNSMGQGRNFLQQLAAGQPVTGQSATTGIAPLNYGTLDQLMGQIGQTPVFNAATAAAQGLRNFHTPAAPTVEDLLGTMAPVSQAPALPAPPALGPVGAPGVPALGPGSELTPSQRAIFDQFRAAAPGVPLDIAMAVARDPASFRAFSAGLPPAPAPTPTPVPTPTPAPTPTPGPGPGPAPNPVPITRPPAREVIQKMLDSWAAGTQPTQGDLQTLYTLASQVSDPAPIMQAAQLLNNMLSSGVGALRAVEALREAASHDYFTGTGEPAGAGGAGTVAQTAGAGAGGTVGSSLISPVAPPPGGLPYNPNPNEVSGIGGAPLTPAVLNRRQYQQQREGPPHDIGQAANIPPGYFVGPEGGTSGSPWDIHMKRGAAHAILRGNDLGPVGEAMQRANPGITMEEWARNILEQYPVSGGPSGGPSGVHTSRVPRFIGKGVDKSVDRPEKQHPQHQSMTHAERMALNQQAMNTPPYPAVPPGYFQGENGGGGYDSPFAFRMLGEIADAMQRPSGRNVGVLNALTTSATGLKPEDWIAQARLGNRPGGFSQGPRGPLPSYDELMRNNTRMLNAVQMAVGNAPIQHRRQLQFAPLGQGVGDRIHPTSTWTRMSEGGGIMVTEPSVLLGLRTGRPLATVGEPTARYPEGIPELVQPMSGNRLGVTPPRMAGGGILQLEGPRRKKGHHGSDRFGIPSAPLGGPELPPAPQPPPVSIPEPKLGIPDYQGGSPGGLDPKSMWPDYQGGWTRGYGSPGGGGGGGSPNTGSLLQRLMSLSPRSYYNMSPSEQDILFSITRALGMPEQDARWSIQRSFPKGIDPSQILTAGF